MKRICILLVLVIILGMAGCCYAPGNEQAPFIEKWLNLPTLPMEEYEPASIQATTPGETVGPVSSDGTAIEAPVVNLDGMPDRTEADFVKVTDYIPDAVVDLKYATANNFTGAAVYDFTDVYLRYSTVLKLMKVQDELRQQGYLLKIWDGFRPIDAQRKLWEAKPDPNYVSNPDTGTNSHARGNTVDVTLVNAAGEELEMPTGFDDFTTYADRDFSDCTDTAASNAQLLQEVMEKYGFEGLQSEWWHFTESIDYEIETVFDPGEVSAWYAVCNEYINIRSAPDGGAGSIGKVKANEQFTLLGWASNNFAYIDFNGLRGYVNGDYIAKVS